MYFSKNSRYVLQKAQWFTPSSCFFMCLKGNEKNFAIKIPKEDPKKPPLRRNIPTDSSFDCNSNVITETNKRELSQQRSKSLVSKTSNASPPVFDDGLLPRSESEIQLPKFTPEQYFVDESQKAETDRTKTESPHEQSTQPVDEVVGDILISVKAESNDGPEKNLVNEKDRIQAHNISDEPKTRVNQMEGSGDERNLDLGNSNNKIVHIIIDFPQKLDENLNLEFKSPKENTASKPKNLVKQVFTVENKERGMQKFKLKVPKKWRSRNLTNEHKSHKRFEVQEIDDSGTYILHLKFKDTPEVEVVPEKEVTTRKTNQDFSLGMLGSDSKTKEIIADDNLLEGIKYRENKTKLKRETKTKSFSPAQIDSETSENIQADGLVEWQQPQYYGLTKSDSSEVNKTSAPPQKNESKKFKSDTITPVSNLPKAKEAEPAEVSPRENWPVGIEAKTEAGEPAIELSGPAERENLPAEAVTEEHGEQKEPVEHERSSQENNEEFATISYRDPHEYVAKAKSASADRPPPTDWMIPNFVGSTAGRSNEVETKPEKKSRVQKKFRPSTSSDSKKGKKKSNKSTYNPGSKIVKSEKCDYDMGDFKSRANSVPIKCDKPTYVMKLSAAYPPLLNEAMKRRYYRYSSNAVFSDKSDLSLLCKEYEMNPNIIEVTPVQVTERNEHSDVVGCEGDGSLLTNKTTSAPKISDNVCNMASENVTNNTGTAPVDSLAIMKKVKEIVDLDLNNAIKIFKPDSGSVVSSVLISNEVGEWMLDEKELRKCLIIQKSEFLNDVKKAESAPDFFGDVGVNLPKYLPSATEGQAEMKLNYSVVILNPDTNKFAIDVEDLQEAIKRRTKESFDDVVVEKLKGLLTGSKSEPILVFDAADNERMTLKSGDSILVFDEETQQWKVDYSILDKRREQMKVEEELTKRSELILETIEKLEKNNVPSITKPETRDRKTFDYNKKQWKDYESDKKSKSVKSPFKESDAKEIRRKNSDLYENLFVKKDKIKKTEGAKSNEIKLSKQINTTESGTTNETPGMPQKSETIPKEPEPISQKKETPVELDKKAEDDNYWETFLNITAPEKKEKEILDVTESKKPKIRAPGPPPPAPAPPTPPKPPVSPPTGPKIEEPKFKIKIPLMEGDKKKKVKDIPPKEKMPKAPEVKEKPKLKLPLPTSKTEKQKESKVTVPPSPQPPAPKKKDPTVKPLSPPTPTKKEDPKPLTNIKKEGPKETLIPVKKKENDVTSSTSSIKKVPKTDNKKEPKVKAPPPSDVKLKDDPKNSGKKDKAAADHYISDNIVELSRNLKDKNSKIKSNKIETVKLNIIADRRLPSKVMEINLNKKLDKSKESTEASKKKKKSEKGIDNRIFYKKFEKYKSPFSDLEYEEKSMKIKSDTASNPNLKKLGNRNKTLVLHDIAKPPENIESWLKDETDKMATLLLKVLQEASDGKPRRKPSRAKIADKTHPKPNPYDNIRKKQETPTYDNILFKSQTAEKMLEVKSAVATKEDAMKTPQFISVVPAVKPSPTSLEKIDPLNPLVAHDFLHQCRLANEITDDIPGPEVLKRISNTWKIFPVVSTQMTIFTLLRLFQFVNAGKLILDIGNAGKNRQHAFSKLFAKYGPIVNIQGLLSGSVILIHKPEHLSAVFEQDAFVPVRSVFDSLEKSRRESEDKCLPIGTCIEWNTPKWAELKKNTNDPLIRGSEKFFTTVEATCDALVNDIFKNKNQQNYASENFLDEIKRWSLESLCNVLFEKSFGFLEGKSKNTSWMLEPDKLYAAVEEATLYLSKCERGFQMWRLMTTPAAAGLKQSYRTLSGIIGKQIYQAEASLENKNEMLKNKMQVTKDLTFVESMLLNDGMTPEEITCNLIDITLIGTNAMASALGFLLYDLAQNTKVQNKLLNDLKDTLPNKSSRMDIHKFSSLKYLQACLKESLRLHVPVPIFSRMLQNDIILANYIIPKGTYVVMDYRVSCAKEQIFEEPEKFNPERWLEDEKWIHSFHPFTTFPLCHGPRAELAKKVVEMQILACVAKIVRNFQVEYQFGEIQETESIIAFPDKPLKFNFIERDS